MNCRLRLTINYNYRIFYLFRSFAKTKLVPEIRT